MQLWTSKVQSLITALERQITFVQPGFGSSNFGVCITELVDGMVNVLHAEEYHRPDFNETIKTTVRLRDKYNIRFDNSCRIFVDAANPSFISTLKQAVNEDPDYTKQIQYYKHNYPSIYDIEFLQQNMFVIPVSFSKEHKNMLAHAKELISTRMERLPFIPSLAN